MIVSTTLTVPAATSEDAPLRLALAVPGGTIRRWWVGWRYGIADLVGLRVLYHETQLLPWSIGEYLPGYVGVTEFPSEVDVSMAPRVLTLEAYNLDDLYPHTLWLACEVSRENVWAELFKVIVEALRWSQYG